jgi:hypothetical protein
MTEDGRPAAAKPVFGRHSPVDAMEAYFRTTSYALVATAFLAIALTGQLDFISIAGYAVALVVCFYRDARGVERLRLREWVWRAMSIAYVPFVFLDGALISNRVLALVHMTLFVSAAKLFQNKRDRDWVFLYLIAFFQMLLAAGLTFNATFVASLAVFLFFFISTLAAFEIRRAGRQVNHLEDETIASLKQPPPLKYRKGESQPDRKTRRLRYLLGASLAQIIIITALTLPFFFLIPRFAGGGVSRGYGEGEAVTGFSDRVELGQVASIKRSARVVMRVRLDRKPSRYLRWRGVALETYDGRAWSLFGDAEHSERERRQPFYQERNSTEGTAGDASFYRDHILSKELMARQSDSRKLQSNLSNIEEMIVLEPLMTDTLFAAQKAFRLRAPLGTVYKDRLTDALSCTGLKGRTPYVVSSDITMPSDQELRADAPALAPDPIKKIYLQRPPKLDPRISHLARDITRNAPTPYDKARAIEAYLKTEFHYTLDLKLTSEDPLSDFLFNTREGHCEYFATAMVILLRSLEIPARIVNGFQMGEYNELNDMYTVRESDAHSWVEAYFPHTDSWIEFDPTPSAGINDYGQGGLFAQLRKYADAMEVFWMDYIVSLDSEEQASIMVNLQHRLLTVKDRVLGYYLAAKNWMQGGLDRLIVKRKWSANALLELAAGVALLGLAGVLAYIGVSYRKRRRLPPTGYGPWWHRLFVLPTWRRRLKRRDYRQSAVLFYEQMLAISRRAGLLKQPHQTPVEFAVASGLIPINEITTLYNRVRFGGQELDENETRRVSDLLAELKQDIRNKR